MKIKQYTENNRQKIDLNLFWKVLYFYRIIKPFQIKYSISFNFYYIILFNNFIKFHHFLKGFCCFIYFKIRRANLLVNPWIIEILLASWDIILMLQVKDLLSHFQHFQIEIFRVRKKLYSTQHTRVNQLR